ncbi:histidine kinase [Paenibacillus yonginensis]|uniref:histidine kinase n=1 Tax=Paenibacillus yonginensis TaxID=1462996 RepID=A0A1B1MZ54_9BACL|nr:HAMP domain-containing sensor histidine kinase [Paenibacillus yonginensis]ANS74454.1 histidine kinase [Paenibacillus yonginensis]
MRRLRIRSFTLLCFCFILFLPWLFFITAHFIVTRSFEFPENPRKAILQHDFNRLVEQVESGAGRWAEPAWQKQLKFHLQQAQIDVVIQSAADQIVYQSSPQVPSRLSSSIERYSLIEDGRLLGRATFYLPKSYTVQVISALAGLLLAFFIIGFEMSRFLLKPLEKMSRAARQIAAGDWEAELPVSRIEEIAEVGDGFRVMVNGLQQANRKQAELEAERRFVIAAVAHDLRTPLFALRGYLDGLEQGIAHSPEKIAKYVAVCKEKSAQLDLLVEDLFTYTKLEYIPIEPGSLRVDFRNILSKSIDSLQPLARKKEIALTIEAGEDGSGCIAIGDAHLLERAINNLLDNAVRHTPRQGEIAVWCKQEGDKIKFAVRDTGPGFPAEELQHVFEPLYRGETSRSRSTGGSGLGLTISQNIIRRHGGELTASNHPDGGALLCGWIPVKIASERLE